MKTKPQSDESSEKINSLPEQDSLASDSNFENISANPDESELLTDTIESLPSKDNEPLPDEMSPEEPGKMPVMELNVSDQPEQPALTEKIENEVEESVAETIVEVKSDTDEPIEPVLAEDSEDIIVAESAQPEVEATVPEVIADAVSEVAEQAELSVADEPDQIQAVQEPELMADNSSPEPLEEAEGADGVDSMLPVAEVASTAELISETLIEASEVTEVIVDETPKTPEGDKTDDEESDDQEEEAEEENVDDLDGMTREELVARLEELVKEEDVNKIKDDVSKIKVAFLKLNKEFKHEAYQKLVESTNNPDVESIEVTVIPDDEVEEKFKAAFQIYKQNKFRFNEGQEKLKIQNLEAKNKILEELKALISSEETLKKTYDEFKILQDRWKAVGMVPKAEINNLWQNYHFLVEKFFDKVKINKELKDLDLKKNLEAKIELCGKAEELLLETSIIKSFKNLQQYHEEWKEIGPVPQDKKDELWERFRSATDKINDRRREYYNEMQEGLEQNLSAKTILCEKAEQIIASEYDSLKSWQDSTNQMTELLKIWKTLGPAPKKQNNEIWARFKKSLDAFFNAKKDFYNKLKEQQMHNYNLKLDLCLQAEALRTSTDWRNTSRELINMQNEWKKLGPVPRKQSDKIWKRFRAACDEFFAAKNEYFKNVSGHEEENMKLKLELIEKAKAFEIGESRNEAIDTLKEFQRQWMGIGHVPIKEKEKLQTEFRAIINKHFEKLKMDSVSIGTMNYRARVDRITKDSPDAGKIISKERSFVQGKIQQLQDEIKTWENNIGFFANSKTANLLKQEFEKKIEKAKEELRLLGEKLKMLRETNQ
ncbi:MAG: DUF349 domain-containing protein [Lentimicrobium sp.]|nr:DUF349 domain-containing protein [Lentimicrobium sp.]